MCEQSTPHSQLQSAGALAERGKRDRRRREGVEEESFEFGMKLKCKINRTGF